MDDIFSFIFGVLHLVAHHMWYPLGVNTGSTAVQSVEFASRSQNPDT